MKIFVLGSAGDQFASARGVRTACGLVIRSGSDQLHFNPGPGIVSAASAAGVNVREHIAVLSSKDDILHSGGISELVSAMSLGGYDVHGVLLAPDNVIEGENRFLHPSCETFVERIVSLENVPRVGINSFEVKIVDFDNSYVFQVSDKTNSLLLLGFGVLEEEQLNQFSLGQIISVSAAGKSPEQIIDYCKLLDSILKPRAFLLTRFSYDQLRADVLALGRSVGHEVGCPVIVAEDGLVVDSSTYPTRSR